MQDRKREEFKDRLVQLCAMAVINGTERVVVDLPSLLELFDSEISKAKEEVLETAKEIIDGKSIYSNNGCGTPLELLDWFVESELDKLSNKRE